MTGRERVTRAIEFTGPDKVPHQKRDFWFLIHVPPQAWQPPDGLYPYVHPLILKGGVREIEERRGDRSWKHPTRC